MTGHRTRTSVRSRRRGFASRACAALGCGTVALGAAGAACGGPDAATDDLASTPGDTASAPAVSAPADTVPADSAPGTPLSSPDRSGPVGVLRAFGNEPFWAMTVSPDSVRLMDLATGDTIAWPSPEPTVASGRPPELARAWVLDAAGPVVLLVRRTDEGCSDGMSDNLYPWFALFLRGDRLYEGCARMDDPPVDPRRRMEPDT